MSLTLLTSESAPKAALQTFLSTWFDGSEHTVGGQTAAFPKARLAFGSSPGVQPLSTADGYDPVEIRCVQLPRMEARHDITLTGTTSDLGKLVTQPMALQFWVRAKREGLGQSEKLAERTAELLKGVLTDNDAKLPLAQAGLTSLICQAPVPGPGQQDGAMRLVLAVCLVQYEIQG